MARDIGLLHRAVKLLPPVSFKDLVDLDMVLDELWMVTKEEMDFQTEAANLEEFARRNKEIAFVGVPKLYQVYTNHLVLVMEYIEGYAIDDREHLEAEGYDLEEIGSKLVDHYIKQVMEDGFFHADPHPGNLWISKGQIAWLDLGMAGHLSANTKLLLQKAIRALLENDI